MHPQRQRITLHDLTALRVGINGERVQAPMPRSRKQASATRIDERGNAVVARPFLKPRKRRLDLEDERTNVADGEADNGEEDDRAQKRRRRDHYIPDLLPFLHHSNIASHSGDDERRVENLPSSDLLKVVHHFASCYYDERGLLTAAARPARVARRAKEKGTPKSHSPAQINENDGNPEAGSMYTEEDTQADDWVSKGSPTRPGRSMAAIPESTRLKDMYKSFDGSTLLLIGMLLQSHIESQINRPPPLSLEWEETLQMEKRRLERRLAHGRGHTRPQPEGEVSKLAAGKAESSENEDESEDESTDDEESSGSSLDNDAERDSDVI